MTDKSDSRSRPRRMLASVALGLGALVTLLVILEGVLSLGRMLLTTAREAQDVPTEFHYTTRHPALGWVSKSGMSVRDGYGPWRTLHTNRAGMRADADFEGPPAEGLRRILCVGGSSVFGVGVGDDETWCARLGLTNAGFETVNLGQPGHDPGQALLHYRERGRMPHDVVLFALDDSSLQQLFADHYGGFPKPWLRPGEVGLEIENTPVPRVPYLWPWATVNRELLGHSSLFDALFPATEVTRMGRPGLVGNVLMSSLLVEVLETANQHEAQLVLVFLPGHASEDAGAQELRLSLLPKLELRDIPHLDLAQPFSQMSAAFWRNMLYPQGYLTPSGHYWAAGMLEDGLAGLESVEGFDDDGERPWLVRFYRDPEFNSPAGRRWYPMMSAHWSLGAPLPGLPADGFGAVFDSCLSLDRPERVRVMLEADGPAQLVVNDQSVLETGEGEGLQRRVNTVALPAGVNSVRVRYVDSGGSASVHLVAGFEQGRPRVPGPERFTAPALSGSAPVCR